MNPKIKKIIDQVWGGNSVLTPSQDATIDRQPTSDLDKSNFHNALVACGKLEAWRAAGSPVCEEFKTWWNGGAK